MKFVIIKSDLSLFLFFIFFRLSDYSVNVEIISVLYIFIRLPPSMSCMYCCSPVCFLYCGALGLLERCLSFFVLHLTYFILELSCSVFPPDFYSIVYKRYNDIKHPDITRVREDEESRKDGEKVLRWKLSQNSITDKRQFYSFLHFSRLLPGRHG